MGKLFFLFVLLWCAFFNGEAQNVLVKGKVMDEKGEPLNAVTVVEKGTNHAVATSEDGSFSMSVAANAELTFSEIGYETFRVSVKGRSRLDIHLSPSQQNLSEVVVTGVGVATSKKKTPIDIGTLSGKDVAKSNLGSVEEALVGKIAGAQVQLNTGTPGTGASIILRGLNSLGDSYPLVMVDGMEVADLNGLDMGNVDHIEVVKGAAGGMLYGAQGANGVIQVFTKKGLKGSRPQVSLLAQASTASVLTGNHSIIANHHSFITDAQGFITANGVRISQDATGAWQSPDVQDPAANPFVMNNLPYKEQTYDHLKQAYRSASTFNNTINVAGGSEKMDYSFTLSRYDEQNVLSNQYSKTSIGTNLGMEIVKGLTIRNILQNIFTDANLISGDPDISVGSNTSRFNMLASFPFVNFKQLDSTGHYIQSVDQGNRQTVNPLAEQQWHELEVKANRIIENADLNYKFPRFVEIDYRYGIEIWNTDQTNYYLNQTSSLQADIVHWGSTVDGSIADSYEKFIKQNSLLSAYLRTDFQSDFHLNIPIKTVTEFTYDYRKTDDRSYFAQGTTLPTYPPYNINVATGHTSGDYSSTFVTYGYLFNQTIDYKDLLGISGGFRSDYSSAFGQGSKPFTFPRGTIYFRPSELLQLHVLPEWKLRAAYGEAGIQPGAYDRQPTLLVAQLGDISTISNQFQIPNAGLRVQQSKELEIGTDASFNIGSETWFPAISLSFTYWRHTNTDIIQPADISPSSGYSARLDNLTTIESKGIDFSLDANITKTKNFNWQFGFRLGTAKSVATVIANGATIVNGIFTVKQGQELGLFSFQAPLSSIGQLQEDGKTPYIDPADQGKYQIVNGMVVDTASKKVQMTNTTDQKNAGSAYPDFTASFFNTFTLFNNFIFAFQWDWYHGNKIYNTTRQWLYRDRLSADFDKSVTINGQTGPYVAYYNSLYNNVSPSTWFVEPGSFFRLRDISLTYQFATGLGLKWARQLSLTVSGRNLITFTKYSGIDPEATTTADSQGNLAGQGSSTPGVAKGSLAPPPYSGAIKGADYFNVPNLKSFQISLRVGF